MCNLTDTQKSFTMDYEADEADGQLRTRLTELIGRQVDIISEGRKWGEDELVSEKTVQLGKSGFATVLVRKEQPLTEEWKPPEPGPKENPTATPKPASSLTGGLRVRMTENRPVRENRRHEEPIRKTRHSSKTGMYFDSTAWCRNTRTRCNSDDPETSQRTRGTNEHTLTTERGPAARSTWEPRHMCDQIGRVTVMVEGLSTSPARSRGWTSTASRGAALR
jgi:hypothetical protein